MGGGAQGSGRYHISPRTGAPAWCTAKVRCPFGDMVKDHFSSKEEARAAYEERMSAQALPSFERGRVHVTPLPPGMKQSPTSFVVPPGVYVVGDPVYTAGVDEKAWGDWEAAIEGEKASQDKALGASFNGYPVLALATAGEGIYHDSMGRAYSSRSGYLGLIPISLAKQMGLSTVEVEDDGYLITFNETSKVEWDKGTLYFGERLFVQTEPELEGLESGEGPDDFFNEGFAPEDFSVTAPDEWYDEAGNFF